MNFIKRVDKGRIPTVRDFEKLKSFYPTVVNLVVTGNSMIALTCSFLSLPSGQAAYNPNFEEIKGDWRERIRARSAKSGYPAENT